MHLGCYIKATHFPFKCGHLIVPACYGHVTVLNSLSREETEEIKL